MDILVIICISSTVILINNMIKNKTFVSALAFILHALALLYFCYPYTYYCLKPIDELEFQILVSILMVVDTFGSIALSHSKGKILKSR